jgi:hypothetical protein
MSPKRADNFVTSDAAATIDVYLTGKVVRFELHAEPADTLMDFMPEDADRIGRALIRAAGVYNLDGSRIERTE